MQLSTGPLPGTWGGKRSEAVAVTARPTSRKEPMTLIALALFIATVPSVPATGPQGASYGYEAGWAKHYSPNRMQSVLRVRQRQGLIPYGVTGYDGLASTTSCSNIGKYVWVQLWNPHTGRWSSPLKLLAVDCSRPGADRDRHIRERLVCEVDYATARATGWGWNGSSGEGKTRARVWGVR